MTMDSADQIEHMANELASETNDTDKPTNDIETLKQDVSFAEYDILSLRRELEDLRKNGEATCNVICACFLAIWGSSMIIVIVFALHIYSTRADISLLQSNVTAILTHNTTTDKMPNAETMKDIVAAVVLIGMFIILVISCICEACSRYTIKWPIEAKHKQQ